MYKCKSFRLSLCISLLFFCLLNIGSAFTAALSLPKLPQNQHTILSSQRSLLLNDNIVIVMTSQPTYNGLINIGSSAGTGHRRLGLVQSRSSFGCSALRYHCYDQNSSKLHGKLNRDINHGDDGGPMPRNGRTTKKTSVSKGKTGGRGKKRINYATKEEDPHIILNVQPWASAEEIKRAYHRAALQYHPDVRTDISSTEEERQKANHDFSR